MKNVSDYLSKFKNLKPPKRSVLNKFNEVVYEICGIKLKNYEVSVQNNIIFVTTNPIVKSEIILAKGKIIREMDGFGYIKEIR